MKTVDIKKNDYMLDDARVNTLFRNKAKTLLSALRAKGYPVIVIQVMRSKAQAALNKLKGTSLVGTKSLHCKGLAMDVAFVLNNKITFNPPPEYWVKYGEAAESFGLTWGGRWKKLVDSGHVELS